VQTALYIDFAWVYFSRQRVKLRAGGVVDSEDLSRGWLVGRLVGKHQDLEDGMLDDEREDAMPARRHGQANGAKKRAWGKRGISVSADEGLRSEDAQPLTDPGAFEDLSDDEGVEDVVPPAESSSSSRGKTSRQETGVLHDADAVGDGSEWVDDEDEHVK
jgi:ER lumen protein retaining receptor